MQPYPAERYNCARHPRASHVHINKGIREVQLLHHASSRLSVEMS